jgi:hypothetical protein
VDNAGDWWCGACFPAWAALAALAESAERAAAEIAGSEGVRSALSFADAGAVAAENALDCRSAERFLRAVAVARERPAG